MGHAPFQLKSNLLYLVAYKVNYIDSQLCYVYATHSFRFHKLIPPIF